MSDGGSADKQTQKQREHAQAVADGHTDRWEDTAKRLAPDHVDMHRVDPLQVKDILASSSDMGEAGAFNWQDVNRESGRDLALPTLLPQTLTERENQAEDNQAAWDLTRDWALGEGRSHRVFGPDSVETRQMQKSIQADTLREEWYGKFKGARSPQELGDLTNVNVEFHPWDIPRAGSNDMSQFVGSARGEARYNPEEGTVTFMLHNPTSVNRAARRGRIATGRSPGVQRAGTL